MYFPNADGFRPFVIVVLQGGYEKENQFRRSSGPGASKSGKNSFKSRLVSALVVVSPSNFKFMQYSSTSVSVKGGSEGDTRSSLRIKDFRSSWFVLASTNTFST